MLSPGDAGLVARDAAISGLAVLLDPDAFAATLRAALPAAGIGAATPLYVRYKPRTSCLVHYSLESAAGATSAYARAYAPDVRGKLHHVRKLQRRPGALGVGALALDGLDIAVYSWPYDHELGALPRLADPQGRAELLGRLCPVRPDLAAAALRPLRHRPERRYVGRLAGAAGGDAVVKLYCEHDYPRARAAAGAIRSSGPLRVAAALGRCDEERALLFQWQPGTPLAGVLWGGSAGHAAVRQAGAALAELHRQPAHALPAGDARAETLAAAEAVAAIYPALAGRARGLASALAEALDRPAAAQRPLHGDFYADQVLVGAGYATLLDLDNAHWGDPASDLGNFCAHLRRAVAVGEGAGFEAARLEAALYEGYATLAEPPSPGRLAAYTAIGLLRLAAEPFRRRSPLWPDQVSALVAAAEQSVGEEQRGVA